MPARFLALSSSMITNVSSRVIARFNGPLRSIACSRTFATVVTPANEIDKGSIIKQKWKEDGPSEYWEINNVRQVKQGRQAAHVSLEYTNLTSNKPERWKGSTTAKFNVVKVEKQACQILYWDNDEKVFFVQDDQFNQQELPQKYVKEASKFLKNGDQVTLWLDDDEIVKVSVPAAILDASR